MRKTVTIVDHIDSSTDNIQASPFKLETLDHAAFMDIEHRRRTNYGAYLDLKRQLIEAKTAIVDFDTQHPPLKSPLIKDN